MLRAQPPNMLQTMSNSQEIALVSIFLEDPGLTRAQVLFSIGNGRNSMVCNSGIQQAIVIKLEISSNYLIQYILGENPGNPTLLIN